MCLYLKEFHQFLIYYIHKVDLCSPLRSLDLTLIRLEIIKFRDNQSVFLLAWQTSGYTNHNSIKYNKSCYKLLEWLWIQTPAFLSSVDLSWGFFSNGKMSQKHSEWKTGWLILNCTPVCRFSCGSSTWSPGRHHHWQWCGRVDSSSSFSQGREEGSNPGATRSGWRMHTHLWE